MQPVRLVLGDARTLETQLADEIQACKLADPLAPVTVAIGNIYLRPYLRRALARSIGGHLNLHLQTMNDLARSLGEPIVAQDRELLPRFGDQVLAQAVAMSVESGYFAPVSRASGFGEALRSLFQDLEQSAVSHPAFASAITRQPDPSGKLRALAGLYSDYEEKRSVFYNSFDCYPAADVERFAAEQLFIFGLWDFTPLQRNLIERMMEHVPVTVFLPESGTNADDAHEPLRNWLLEHDATVERPQHASPATCALEQLREGLFQSTETPIEPDGSVQLVSAPDPPREVREAARACLRWAREGIPFHEMAVVYRSGERYRPLIDQIFSEIGITTYQHSGHPLGEHPQGRRLLALLRLVGTEMHRSSVMEFLTETVLPDATLAPYGDVQMSSWDKLSRQAGIVEGTSQWSSRLKMLAQTRRDERITAEEEPDTDLQSQLDEIDNLRAFIEQFFDDLGAFATSDSWSSYLEILSWLAQKYIAGIDQVLGPLDVLNRFEPLASRVEFDRFRQTVRRVIDQQDASHLLRSSSDLQDDATGALQPGMFHRQGVNVLDVRSLQHLRFQAVVILGVAERSFPPPPRQDPLLLDVERAALNTEEAWDIPCRIHGRDDEALQFLMAISAANERLQVSFPRGETGAMRPHLPSHFYRALASAMQGEPVSANDIDQLSPKLYLRIPSGSFGVSDIRESLDASEYDRSLLETAPLLGLDVCQDDRPTLGAARIAWLARWRDPEATEYDGVLSPDLARDIRVKSKMNRTISPSRIETYATCPYRFFMRYVLRLEPNEEPETLERISPLERGSLIHKVLERFLEGCVPDDPPSASRKEAHLALLRQIAEEEFKTWENQGLVGYKLLWQFDRTVMLEDLEEWYEVEIDDYQQSGLLPAAAELRFGRAWGTDRGSDLSSDEPFVLRVGDVTLRFQGRVDRVDVAPDRTHFRIVDYKTGRVGRYHKEDSFSEGRAMQLPIYLIAASHLLNIPWQSSRAEYHFPTSRGGFGRVAMSGPSLQENWPDLVQLFEGLIGSIERGMFTQVPMIGKDGNNCRFCDYQDVCPGRINQIAQRKTGSRAVIELRQLIGADQ